MLITTTLPNQMAQPWNQIVFKSMGVEVAVSRGALIGDLRDYAIIDNREGWKYPLKHGCQLRDSEGYLFVDQDIFPPLDALSRLRDYKEKHPDTIIAGMHKMRQGDNQASYWKSADGDPAELKDRGLVPADVTTMGFCFIPSSVFEKISWPYFPLVYEKEGDKVKKFGEDVGFCKKARKAGIKINVATDIRCTHLGVDKIEPGLPWYDYIFNTIQKGETK